MTKRHAAGDYAMTLNKKHMVREVGRRTRLSNHDVERVIETLVEVWTEELVSGGRIELERFMVLETQRVERCRDNPVLRRTFRQVKLRTSQSLRDKLNALGESEL
ncbi:MAG: HU family DNA-binding protein [Chloroflexota bacterium]|nr:HU family DNA-binding protein [Chloroflexota bacterium]